MTMADPQRHALVFLHFFGGSARSWNRVIARLAGEYETLAIDLPGFGAEAEASGPYTVAAYADFVAAAVRARGLDDYVLVGHSMGGKIALALAARRPQGLRSLVLLAPSPPTPEPIEEEMRASLIAGWGHYGPASETLARVTARPLSGDLRERTIADMMNSGKCAWMSWLQHGSREDISAAMSCIDVPVIVLSGDCDEALPCTLIQREVVDRLGRASFVRVPDSGHLLPLEAPNAVAELIRRGVEGLWSDGRHPAVTAKYEHPRQRSAESHGTG